MRSGWRFQRENDSWSSIVYLWRDVEHLVETTGRLKDVGLENDEATKVIQRYDTPDTLFYCDPPYPAGVRSARWGKKAYQHEMTRKDHILLAELLNDIQGMAIVSSYPSRLYDRLYVGWSLVTHPARSNGNRNMLEQLWISPNTRKRSKQQRLF